MPVSIYAITICIKQHMAAMGRSFTAQSDSLDKEPAMRKACAETFWLL